MLSSLPSDLRGALSGPVHPGAVLADVLPASKAAGIAELQAPGFDRTSAAVDSQVRFIGPVFAGYGLAWIEASSGEKVDLFGYAC